MAHNSILLAAEVAGRLSYTTDDLDEFCNREGNERYADVQQDRAFFKAIDTMIFKCVGCEYWKHQHENAAPRTAGWICIECVSDGA